jgi:pantothenate kinase-related protein Tda10
MSILMMHKIVLCSAAAQSAPRLLGRRFRHNACEQLKKAFAARIAGQDIPLDRVRSSICSHLEAEHHQRPLVLHLSGPPGVGKSLTAQVAAQVRQACTTALPIVCRLEL